MYYKKFLLKQHWRRFDDRSVYSTKSSGGGGRRGGGYVSQNHTHTVTQLCNYYNISSILNSQYTRKQTRISKRMNG